MKIEHTNYQQNFDPLHDAQWIGENTEIVLIRDLFERRKGMTLPIFIMGESGSGKALAAHLFHYMSKISHLPFVKISPHNYHHKMLESIETGTVFIPHIEELRKSHQQQLAEYLDKIGESKQVRFIASTNFSRHTLLEENKILSALFFRLHVINVDIPPLRDRLDDIPSMAQYFLEDLGINSRWNQEALEALKSFSWPGNVRELKNFVHEISLQHHHITGQLVQERLQKKTSYNQSFQQTLYTHIQKHFQAHNDDLPPAGLHKRVFHEVERVLIHLTLKATNGNQIKASQVLGINRNTLRKKILSLKLKFFEKDQE